MLQADRAEKVDEKKSGHLCSFHVSFLTYDPEIVETSRYALSENVIVYYAMTSCFEDISV